MHVGSKSKLSDVTLPNFQTQTGISESAVCVAVGFHNAMHYFAEIRITRMHDGHFQIIVAVATVTSDNTAVAVNSSLRSNGSRLKRCK